MAFANLSTGNYARLSPGSVDALIERWDPVIRRMAYSHARRFNRVSDANDFAQEARIRLFLKARTHGNAPDPYIRKMLSNAILGACLRCASADFAEPLTEDVEQIATEVTEEDHLQKNVVGNWLCDLHPRLWSVCDLIYFKGRTQAEAAEILAVSQPRIAQMHRQLLLQGQDHLRNIPAVR